MMVTPSKQKNNVAADTTILQSASSFIQPYSGRADPRAERSFDTVATAFCNCSNLFLPLPSSFPRESPFLLELWRHSGVVSHLQDYELSETAFDEEGAHLAETFALFAEGDAPDVARWLAFQVTPEIVNGDMGDAYGLAVRRPAPLVRNLISSGKLARLVGEIQELQRTEHLRVPLVYDFLVGTPDIPSAMHFFISFALSIYLRGWSYAANLSHLESPPLYKHAWIRASALRSGFGSAEMSRAEEQPPGAWFPWGRILTAVFNPSSPLAPRDRSFAEEALSGLRRETSYLYDDLAEVLAGIGAPGSSSDLTEAELLVLHVLQEVGIFPRYKESTRPEAMATWLRDLVGQALPILRVPVELITGNLQSRWLRGVELDVRLRFRRDKFWDIFDDPGIRPAIRNYQAQLAKGMPGVKERPNPAPVGDG